MQYTGIQCVKPVKLRHRTKIGVHWTFLFPPALYDELKTFSIVICDFDCLFRINEVSTLNHILKDALSAERSKTNLTSKMLENLEVRKSIRSNRQLWLKTNTVWRSRQNLFFFWQLRGYIFRFQICLFATSVCGCLNLIAADCYILLCGSQRTATRRSLPKTHLCVLCIDSESTDSVVSSM